MNRLPLATLALLSAAIPAAAIAQGAPAPASVTRAQVIAKLDADYARLDTDKNGKASKVEVEKRISTETAAELAELTQRRTLSFQKFDANKDGQISRAEFDTGVPLPTTPAPNAAPVLTRFDANKDGSISSVEFRGPTLSNFDKLDANKDGTLTAAEQQAAAAAGR